MNHERFRWGKATPHIMIWYGMCTFSQFYTDEVWLYLTWLQVLMIQFLNQFTNDNRLFFFQLWCYMGASSTVLHAFPATHTQLCPICKWFKQFTKRGSIKRIAKSSKIKWNPFGNGFFSLSFSKFNLQLM